jgi:hypothetical protein
LWEGPGTTRGNRHSILKKGSWVRDEKGKKMTLGLGMMEETEEEQNMREFDYQRHMRAETYLGESLISVFN